MEEENPSVQDPDRPEDAVEQEGEEGWEKKEREGNEVKENDVREAEGEGEEAAVEQDTGNENPSPEGEKSGDMAEQTSISDTSSKINSRRSSMLTFSRGGAGGSGNAGECEKKKKLTKEVLEEKLCSHRVTEVLQGMLNALFKKNPDDYFGFMSKYLSDFSASPVVSKLVASPILDSNGLPAVRVAVYCIVDGDETMVVQNSAASSTKVSGGEWAILRDGEDDSFEARSVSKACEVINEILSPLVKGREIAHLADIDEELFKRDFLNNFENIGANSVFSASLAMTLACAKLRKCETFEHFGYLFNNNELPDTFEMPRPVVSIFGGRSHANGKIKAKEIFIFPALYEPYTPPEEEAESPAKDESDEEKGEEDEEDGNTEENVEEGLDEGKSASEARPASPPHGKRISFQEGLFRCAKVYYYVGKVLHNKHGPVAHSVQSEGAYVTSLDTPDQAFDIIHDACTHAEVELGKDIFLGIDMAASELYDADNQKYEIAHGQVKPVEDFIKLYEKWTTVHNSALKMIEDPLDKDDRAGWHKLKAKFKDKEGDGAAGQPLLFVGDYLYSSDIEHVKRDLIEPPKDEEPLEKDGAKGAKGKKGDKDSATKSGKDKKGGKGSGKSPSNEQDNDCEATGGGDPAGAEENTNDGNDVNLSHGASPEPHSPQVELDPSLKRGDCLLLKPNQCVTMSRCLDLVRFCHEVGLDVIGSTRSNDSECTFLADLCVGIGAKFAKCGAPSRTERVAKYNRLLAIEEYLRDLDMLKE
eukprot:Nk52_evm14s1671 gene=Nk52_evmTU14s1671